MQGEWKFCIEYMLYGTRDLWERKKYANLVRGWFTKIHENEKAVTNWH